MKLTRSITHTAAAAALLVALGFPLAASAYERGYDAEQHQRLDPEQRAKFARRYLDREAAMLEIKASQQSAWDAYAAAKLELMTGFDSAKPLPPDADAAAIARRNADRAADLAQRLGKLADTTEKLRAALTDDQRKVLDRMAREHRREHERHPDSERDRRHRDGPATAPGMAKPSPKPSAPAKPQ